MPIRQSPKINDSLEQNLRLTDSVVLVASTPKRRGRSFANERQIIELAKTKDLEAIVKRTGRKPENLLKMAKRLGIKIKMVDAHEIHRRPTPMPTRKPLPAN
jgi:hypothetical protein